MSFDTQTIHDLEFLTIKQWLSDFAVSKTAKANYLELNPQNDFDKIKLELSKAFEFLNIRKEGESFPTLDFEELQSEIVLLPIRNSVLSQEGFYNIMTASLLVNSILVFFDKRNKDYPILSEILKETTYNTEIVDAIEKVFTRKGDIRDDASKLLYEIRQKLKALKQKIARNFDKVLRQLSQDNLLGETRETFVNERRVLAVMSTHKRKIEGAVVGSSKTGSLTYIEPSINVELNNEFELLLDDERKEIFRILQQLTKEISVHLELIKNYQKVLVEFDFINAKTKLSLELDANLPQVSDKMEIELIKAYHPILLRNNKKLQKTTLPQSLQMNAEARILVISGPNAGGKSITLKTIGLLQLMLQSGLLIPVDSNSKMCLFQQVLSDIGDNQSIENELSTYSYRLKRMNYFLRVANRRTMLLLDEFGTGSDPDLGGALAEVFFEKLYQKKSFGVITTHYGNIKLKADELKNAFNGCMLFDTKTLEPLYKFSSGQPGSSFTFEVAQMNGISLEIINEAKGKIDVNKIRMDKLLSDLQKEKTYFEQINKEHELAQKAAFEARTDFQQKKQKLDERLLKLSENTEKNEKYIQGGRKLQAFVDKYKINNRKKGVNDLLIDEIRKYVAVEKSKLEDGKKKEILKAEANKPNLKKKPKNIASDKDPYDRHKIVVGSTVKLISSKQSGTVENIKGEEVTVIFGFSRMKIEREKLMWIK